VTVQRAATNGLQFYVDGVPTGAPFNPTRHEGSLSNSAPLVVGALTDSGTYWLGGIDEVEMFSRALSPEEIQAIYSFGTAGKCKPCACTNNCITIACPDNTLYWPTNCPIQYNLQFTDACCGTNWWVVYSPTNGYIFPPNTTNVVTCCVYDSCGNSNCCSFIVVCQGGLLPPPDVVIVSASNGFTLNAANYPFVLPTNWNWHLQESTDLMSRIWTTMSTNPPPYYISNLLLPQQFFRLALTNGP